MKTGIIGVTDELLDEIYSFCFANNIIPIFYHSIKDTVNGYGWHWEMSIRFTLVYDECENCGQNQYQNILDKKQCNRHRWKHIEKRLAYIGGVEIAKEFYGFKKQFEECKNKAEFEYNYFKI